MNINSFMKLSLINLSRRKINLLNCFLIILSLLILFVTFSINDTAQKYIDIDKKNNLASRKIHLYVDKVDEETIKQIKNIDGVSDIIDNSSHLKSVTVLDFVNDDYDGNIEIYGISKVNLPNIVDGSLDNYYNKDYITIICPKFLMPNINIEYGNEWKDKTPIDTKKWLNKDITISNNYYKGIVKIIGTYDTKENLESDRVCYSSLENVSKMNFNDPNIVNDNHLYIVVDKYSNMNKVIEKLTNLGFSATPMKEYTSNNTNIILLLGGNISVIAIIISIFSIYLTYKKNIKSRIKEIFMLKSIGYNDKHIKLLLIIEGIILGFVSFIISLILSFIILQLVKLYFVNYGSVAAKLEIVYSFKGFVLSLVLSLLIPIGSILLSYSNNNINIIEKIKEEF